MTGKCQLKNIFGLKRGGGWELEIAGLGGDSKRRWARAWAPASPTPPSVRSTDRSSSESDGRGAGGGGGGCPSQRIPPDPPTSRGLIRVKKIAKTFGSVYNNETVSGNVPYTCIFFCIFRSKNGFVFCSDQGEKSAFRVFAHPQGNSFGHSLPP